MNTMLEMLNTALLSVVLTLAAVIYKDMMNRINRMDRRVMACLVAMISLVSAIEHIPDEILKELTSVLKDDK